MAAKRTGSDGDPSRIRIHPFLIQCFRSLRSPSCHNFRSSAEKICSFSSFWFDFITSPKTSDTRSWFFYVYHEAYISWSSSPPILQVYPSNTILSSLPGFAPDSILTSGAQRFHLVLAAPRPWMVASPHWREIVSNNGSNSWSLRDSFCSHCFVRIVPHILRCHQQRSVPDGTSKSCLVRPQPELLQVPASVVSPFCVCLRTDAAERRTSRVPGYGTSSAKQHAVLAASLAPTLQFLRPSDCVTTAHFVDHCAKRRASTNLHQSSEHGLLKSDTASMLHSGLARKWPVPISLAFSRRRETRTQCCSNFSLSKPPCLSTKPWSHPA